jgi:DNA repair exonuclease SbcCD ATPase subunit
MHANSLLDTVEHKSIEQIVEADEQTQTEVIQSLIRTCYGLIEKKNNLEQRVKQLEAKEDNENLEQRVERLEAKVDDHDDQLDEHQSELDDHESRLTALGKGISNINDEQADHEDRIESIETNADDDSDQTQCDTGDQSNQSSETHVSPETNLEQVVSLPEPVVDDQLTANQQRARFIARDLKDYTQSIPAGRRMTAGQITRVLRAGTDCKGHSQTVDRVIDFLNDFGEDQVSVKKRRGKRIVVFGDNLVNRIERLTQDRDANHTVVRQARG